MSVGKKIAFDVQWRIENVKSWLETRDDTLYSPQFRAETLMNTYWRLRLAINWAFGEEYIGLIVQRDVGDDGPDFIALDYELSFLACDGSPLKSKAYTKLFVSETDSQELNLKLIEILDKENELNLREDVLTVRCKLWKAKSTTSKGGQCSIRSIFGTKCITLYSTVDNLRRMDFGDNVTLYFLSSNPDVNFISFNVYRNENGNLMLKRMLADCKRFSMYSCRLFLRNGSVEKCIESDNLRSLLASTEQCIVRFDDIYDYLRSNLHIDSLKLHLEIKYYPGVEAECIEYDVINYEELSDESVDLKNVNNPKAEKVDSSDLCCPHLSEYRNEACNSDETGSRNEGKGLNIAGKQRHLPSNSLKNDLTSLFNDRLFCDTKSQTDTETFPAHKCVLSARSPVFKKLFTTDMKEKAGECINILDIGPDTVRMMLQFLYTGDTGDLEMQSAKDLYIASDKYDIASLKERCVSFMKKNLCESNVCEVLVLADMHQDKDLESAAGEFVLTNDKVLGSEEWKLFMKKFSSIAARVMYSKCMNE